MLNSFVVEPDVLYLLLRFAGQNLYIGDVIFVYYLKPTNDIKTYVVGIRVSIQTVSRQRGKQLSHAFWIEGWTASLFLLSCYSIWRTVNED